RQLNFAEGGLERLGDDGLACVHVKRLDAPCLSKRVIYSIVSPRATSERGQQRNSERTMHQEFLQTIIQNPEDDAPRLVYADWLEEHGDADRAEFIRVQCEIAKLDKSDPRHLSLSERSSELHQAHRMEWAEPLSKLAKWFFFERGFIERIGISAQTLLENAEAVFQSAPIREIELLGSARFMEDLANCRYLSQV